MRHLSACFSLNSNQSPRSCPAAVFLAINGNRTTNCLSLSHCHDRSKVVSCSLIYFLFVEYYYFYSFLHETIIKHNSLSASSRLISSHLCFIKRHTTNGKQTTNRPTLITGRRESPLSVMLLLLLPVNVYMVLIAVGLWSHAKLSRALNNTMGAPVSHSAAFRRTKLYSRVGHIIKRAY